MGHGTVPPLRRAADPPFRARNNRGGRRGADPRAARTQMDLRTVRRVRPQVPPATGDRAGDRTADRRIKLDTGTRAPPSPRRSVLPSCTSLSTYRTRLHRSTRKDAAGSRTLRMKPRTVFCPVVLRFGGVQVQRLRFTTDPMQLANQMPPTPIEPGSPRPAVIDQMFSCERHRTDVRDRFFAAYRTLVNDFRAAILRNAGH